MTSCAKLVTLQAFQVRNGTRILASLQYWHHWNTGVIGILASLEYWRHWNTGVIGILASLEYWRHCEKRFMRRSNPEKRLDCFTRIERGFSMTVTCNDDSVR